jgi:hypothetical protein
LVARRVAKSPGNDERMDGRVAAGIGLEMHAMTLARLQRKNHAAATLRTGCQSEDPYCFRRMGALMCMQFPTIATL